MQTKNELKTAAKLKASGKCNCTQAVLNVFEDKISVDDEKIVHLSSGFVVGMESTCGALIGVIMVAEILKKENICFRRRA